MKTFINTKTGITKTDDRGNKVNIGFAGIANMALNSPPQGGWSTDEMRKRIKVMDKLENAEIGDSIELEDAEFEKILECSQIKWKFFHKDIIAFEDYLLKLKAE